MDSSAGFDVEFKAVTKSYGATQVVHGVDLQVPRGAFVALLGPSGCGKTTCLRMVGGFEEPTSGLVRIRGVDMTGVPPHRRPVNMVFQHYALFPHMTVAENVSYGLRQLRPRLAAGEMARRVDEALALVRLSGFGRRRTHQLSGGQQQRVALARAIVNKPAVLLLDEPLAALDKKLRIDMQIELQNLQKQLGITFVLVTHDQEEALSMSDLVCVMNAGRIVQLGPPAQVYSRPADLFVADFVGKTNLLSGRVSTLGTDDVAVMLPTGTEVTATSSARLGIGDAVSLSVRPEAVRLRTAGAGLTGIIRNRIFLGASTEFAIEVPQLGTLIATEGGSVPSHDLKPGETVALDFASGALLAFPASARDGSMERSKAHV